MKPFGWVIRGFLPMLLVLPFRVAVYAQSEGPQAGVVQIGVRTLAGDHASSKFDEYRDLRSGPFVQGFNVNLPSLSGGEYFLNCQARNILVRDSDHRDSDFRCAAAQNGKFRIEFTLNDTPHVFTNSAETLFVQSSPGVFTLPSAGRLLTSASHTPLTQTLAGEQPFDMTLQRRLFSGTFTYTPTERWAFQLQYSHENKQGYRPIGTTTNAFTNQLEMPEPVDYGVEQVKAGAEYLAGRGGFQAGYSASVFSNHINAMVWDNPFSAADAPGAAARGRMSLPPDNSEQALEFAGAYNLNRFTRVMASISPEWMRQNQTFLPETINTAIPNVPALPASSLNGRKTTLAMNYTLTTRPLPRVELTARYRSYDYTNNTPSLFFPSYVATDASVENVARQSLPYGYNSQHLGFDAAWEFLKGQAFKLSYDWEQLDRQYRDAAQSMENSGSAAVDLNPKKWINLKASYKHAERTPNLYQLDTQSYPTGCGPACLAGDPQFPLMMRFDEAARRRDQADALLVMDPTDRLSLTASFGTLQDRYNDTAYGLLRSKYGSYGVDLSYQLTPYVSLFGEYAHEQDRSDQNSRQRSSPKELLSRTENDWQSNISDVIHTLGGGIRGNWLHPRITLDAFYGLSIAKGNIATRALGSAAIPGFFVTTAQDYPETSERFHQLIVTARRRLGPAISARIEYRYEHYGNVDFQTEVMSPYMVPLDPGAGASVFLGARVPRYNVHIVSAVLEYRF
jgi:MtrB/PioB family decaheme-associated outer membrane protein